MSQSAVVERKRAFLRRQKQILMRGIPPSSRLLKIAEQGGIQTKLLNDIMLKGKFSHLGGLLYLRNRNP